MSDLAVESAEDTSQCNHLGDVAPDHLVAKGQAHGAHDDAFNLGLVAFDLLVA